MIDIELPSFLDEETAETILQRMMDALPPDLDKSEGSYIWDSLMPVAIENAKIVEWAKEVLRRGFTTKTFGPYLELKAAEYGLTKRDAVRASGEDLLITGQVGTIIPKGSRFATPSDNVNASIEFETTEQVTIGDSGEVTVGIIAVEPGKEGIVESGAISVVLPGLSGISSVKNVSATTGGYDEESDESLLARIIEESQKDEGDGNIDDYKTWAKEVAGVGNVLVEPQWEGPGTMRVIILNQEGNAAPVELISSVQEHLDPGIKGIGEGRAPTGSKTTVGTASVINISAVIPGLEAESGYTDPQAKLNAEEALRTYLKNINPGGIIRIKEAESQITDAAGVLDIGDLKLNGSRENILLKTTELADLGEVTYL